MLLIQGADYLGVSAESMQKLVEQEIERKQRKLAPAEVMPPAEAFVEQPPLFDPGYEPAPEIFNDWTGFESEEQVSQRDMPGKSADSMDNYCRQLVVALLCEPSLAKSVLEMPSLFSGAEVFGSLPSPVRDFIRALAAGEIVGVGLRSSRTQEAVPPSEEFKELFELLQSNGLDGEALLTEACRQLRVGGGRPDSVVADARHEIARRSLKEELERLRAQEAGISSDAQKLMELAQEKLAKKRALGRIKI